MERPVLHSSYAWFKRAKSILFSNIVMSVGIGIAIAAITLNLDFHRIEAFFYDLRVQLSGNHKLDDRIALLAITDDDRSYQALNSIGSHVKVLEKLIVQKPAAIAFLNRFDPSDIDFNKQDAERFVHLAKEAEYQNIQVVIGTDVDLGGEILAPYPISTLSHFPAIVHKDGTIFSEDKVTRRALLTVMGEPSLHLHLAKPSTTPDNLLRVVQESRGSYYFSAGEVWHHLIRYPGNTSLSHADNYPYQTYSQVLDDQFTPSLKGKIVLIDSLRRDAISDFAYTPYSREAYEHPKLFVQAATLDSLLNDRGIVSIPNFIDIFLTTILCVLLTYTTIRYSPTRGVVSVVVASALLFIISLALFRFAGIWLRLVHPLFSMFFAYYLIVPYRAILEYKMRWEVQQKHDILLEVEEMKGNFLSLMSHDLKTPVARIQGLAELILKQGNLSGEQERETREILYSTESLDKFISKILNLTKVESSQIKLNRKSKDINKIIETCASKLTFQARSKNIKVELKLEPLFPLQIDAVLIIQVLNNLIDNAIKYSPQDGQVTISSRELTDKNLVEITVADSGHGMSHDELARLFTKFFRGQAASGQQLKGSGLGLYLSKYFIELHRGEINVSSQKGRGSVFTITLPMLVAEEQFSRRGQEGVANV